MRGRGHPILGAFGGFFFFLSADLVLLTFGVVNLGSIVLTILPIAGLVLGLIIGITSPFGSREPSTP